MGDGFFSRSVAVTSKYFTRTASSCSLVRSAHLDVVQAIRSGVDSCRGYLAVAIASCISRPVGLTKRNLGVFPLVAKAWPYTAMPREWI